MDFHRARYRLVAGMVLASAIAQGILQSHPPIPSTKIKILLPLKSISVADGSWQNEWANLHQLPSR
jgi:hypothetical protein